jgi:hypothetical protein
MKVLVSEETFPSKKPCTMSVFDLWMKPFQNCIIARVQGTNTMVFVLQPPPLLRLNRWIYLFNILLREKLFVLWQDIRCSWVPNIVSGVRVPQSVVFCVVLCRLLFVFLTFFFLAIALSVLRFAASEYPFGIFKLFFVLSVVFCRKLFVLHLPLYWLFFDLRLLITHLIFVLALVGTNPEDFTSQINLCLIHFAQYLATNICLN